MLAVGFEFNHIVKHQARLTIPDLEILFVTKNGSNGGVLCKVVELVQNCGTRSQLVVKLLVFVRRLFNIAGMKIEKVGERHNHPMKLLVSINFKCQASFAISQEPAAASSPLFVFLLPVASTHKYGDNGKDVSGLGTLRIQLRLKINLFGTMRLTDRPVGGSSTHDRVPSVTYCLSVLCFVFMFSPARRRFSPCWIRTNIGNTISFLNKTSEKTSYFYSLY